MTAVVAARPALTADRIKQVAARRWVWVGALVAVAALAFVIRLRILMQTGGLGGVGGYDDGVYYAAADALVHGRLPYRDFLLLQPPGTIVALTPFAWLGSITRDSAGMMIGRVAFIGVGALNATLAMRIARRFGLLSAVIAGVGYAVYFPAAWTERSTLLEPLGSCGLLVAVLLVQRAHRSPRYGMVLAGVAAGAAVTMRIWYVVPVLLIAAVDWRRSVRFLLGAAAAAVVICLPFFLASPSAMIRQVLLDQLGRPRSSSPSLIKRMAIYLGSTNLHLSHPWAGLLSINKLGVLLMVVVLACAVAALTVRGARLFPLATAASAVVLIASPSFFLHYGALAAPWVVLTVAIGAARLLSLVPSVPARASLAALLILAAAALGLRSMQLSRASVPFPAAALRPAAQQVTGCIESDDPQFLVALDVLSRDLDRGCIVWPDVSGYTYDRDSLRIGGRVIPRIRNPLWQADVTRFLISGRAVIVHRSNTALNRADTARIRSGPLLAHSGTWRLYQVRP